MNIKEEKKEVVRDLINYKVFSKEEKEVFESLISNSTIRLLITKLKGAC